MDEELMDSVSERAKDIILDALRKVGCSRCVRSDQKPGKRVATEKLAPPASLEKISRIRSRLGRVVQSS